MLLQEKLVALRNEKKAILATNFYNFETLVGILRAAAQSQQPIILQLSESSINYMGLKIAVGMARAAIAETGVEAWLHLDHGSNVELVRRCLDEGFDSVMIDASEHPFKYNVELTRQVVREAEPYKACVEAELGYVAKLGQNQTEEGFTSPEDARRFVEETGVHALAVAIGSAHGFYKEPPRLRLDLLEEISRATPIPLVLHGSSGIPDNMLREAILRGITKINLATETKNIFMMKLRQLLATSDEIDLRKVFPPAIDEVIQLISYKIDVIIG
ncbi:MAG: class II fructose-bisphosphate aldolase [Bacteroidales bacterium]